MRYKCTLATRGITVDKEYVEWAKNPCGFNALVINDSGEIVHYPRKQHFKVMKMKRIGNIHNEHEFTGACDNCGEKFMAFEGEINVVWSRDKFNNVVKCSSQKCTQCVAGVVNLTLNKAVI